MPDLTELPWFYLWLYCIYILMMVIESVQPRLIFLKCKCNDMEVLMAMLVTHVAWGQVKNSESFTVMPALQGPSDTYLCPCSRSTAAHNPSLMRRLCRLLCPLALWIRKVLLWLSDGMSNIDLNSLTQLIPNGSTFPPQTLNSSATASFSWCVHSRAGSLPSLPTGSPFVQIN